MYTSLKLSKLLKENGCELESEMYWVEVSYEINSRWELHRDSDFIDELTGIWISAYDILNDICVKYAKEFFGEDNWNTGGLISLSDYFSQRILRLLQQGKTQDEIEEYLWSVCLFNPKKK